MRMITRAHQNPTIDKILVAVKENDMPKAIWNGAVLAESNDTIIVEGNHYFPEDSLKKGFFKHSQTTTICPWKGKASYYTLEVGGKLNKDAAWYYPEPSPEAEKIRGRIAFWRGVEVRL